MSEVGFGPTLIVLRGIVPDYVKLKQLKTRFVNDYPGYNWTIIFSKKTQTEFEKRRPNTACKKECDLKSICCLWLL